MYFLAYHPSVKKQIKFLHPVDRDKIKNALEKLAKKFPSPELNIKKLVNNQRSFRLRVGNLRVIFEIEEKKIYVWKVGYRGQVY